MKFDLTATNGGSDHLALTNTLGKGTGTGFSFFFNDLGATLGTTYTLMTFSSESGFSMNDFSFSSNDPALQGSFALAATHLDFVVKAVPEPSAFILLIGGVGLSLLWRNGKNRV